MSEPKPSTAQVPVIDSYGNFVQIDPADVQDAIKNAGYRVPTSDELGAENAKQQFGTGQEKAKTFMEGVASGATFGASRYLEKAMGVDPKDMANRAKYNPGMNIGGETTGILGSLLIPGPNAVKAITKGGQAITRAATPAAERAVGLLVNPETSPIVHKILAEGSATALGSAVEGAFYGAGQAVSESAMGDPNALGEKLYAHIGNGAMFGGAAGALIGGIGGAAGGVKSKFFTPEIKTAAMQDAIASQTVKTAAQSEAQAGAEGVQGLEQPAAAVEAPQTPSSLPEIRKAIENAKYQALTPELPAKRALQDALDNVPDLEFKPHPLMMESLNNPEVRKIYQAELLSGSPIGQDLQSYESIMKQEATGKLAATVKNLAPGEAIADPVRAGNNLIKSFTDQYEAEKKLLAPEFEKFDQAAIRRITDNEGLVNKLEESIPGSKNLMTVDKDGLKMKPYKPSMPVSRNVYGAIKDLLDTANDESVTLGGIRNVRENMRGRVLPLSSTAKDMSQIGSLRKGLMDYMEDEVQKAVPDLKVREAFKRYAINETHREMIEKIMGGSISHKATFAREIKPEDVLDKVFSNTVTVKAAKEILGEQAFKDTMKNYLINRIDQFTDLARNGFSSNKFHSFMMKKMPELMTAFEENPKLLKRMQSLTDIMRILPDAPPVNPSGTAKTLTLLERIHKVGSLVSEHGISEMFGKALNKIPEAIENAKKEKIFDQLLQGKGVKEATEEAEKRMILYSSLKKMEEISSKITGKITAGAKSVFNPEKSPVIPLAGYAGSKVPVQEKVKKHKETVAMIQDFASDPEKLMDHLDKVTSYMHDVAPSTAQAMQMTHVRAAQFLATKIPTPPPMKPLSGEWTPSMAEITKFERYENALEDPLSLLKQLKNQSVSKESIEAVSAVFPSLFHEMQGKVADELMNFKAKKKKVPYQTRLSLSAFFNTDMDSSLDQQNIVMNQTTLLNPGKEQAENDAQNQEKVSQTGLSALSQSNRLLTPLQSSSQRES